MRLGARDTRARKLRHKFGRPVGMDLNRCPTCRATNVMPMGEDVPAKCASCGSDLPRQITYGWAQWHAPIDPAKVAEQEQKARKKAGIPEKPQPPAKPPSFWDPRRDKKI